MASSPSYPPAPPVTVEHVNPSRLAWNPRHGGRVWNPRFLAYCVSLGEPDPLKVVDSDRFREFVPWIEERWREWHRAVGKPRAEPKTDAEHDAFDRWLADLVWPP